MRVLVALLVLFVSGCSTLKVTTRNNLKIVEVPQVQPSPLAKELKALPELDGPVINIAVYSFQDKTGQRKAADNYASFSSSVTQGAEAWLIESLQIAGNGTWFKVLERTGLDDLIKERQMYRQAREEFEDKNSTNLRPMLFAGVVAQGGIIGYDSNIQTGGIGANVLGIGASSQYRKDVITLSLRLVSTSTGEVLLSTAITKTVFSASINGSALVFVNNGIDYGEAELGQSNNEPGTVALRAAIDAAVIEIIKQGAQKNLWKFKHPIETPRPIVIETKPTQIDQGLDNITKGVKEIIQR